MALEKSELEILKDTVKFVSGSLKAHETVSKKEAAWNQQLDSALDALVANGLLSGHLKEAKRKEFISNPSSVLNALTKVSSLVKPASLGKPEDSGTGTADKRRPESYRAFEEKLIG